MDRAHAILTTWNFHPILDWVSPCVRWLLGWTVRELPICCPGVHDNRKHYLRNRRPFLSSWNSNENWNTIKTLNIRVSVGMMIYFAFLVDAYKDVVTDKVHKLYQNTTTKQALFDVSTVCI